VDVRADPSFCGRRLLGPLLGLTLGAAWGGVVIGNDLVGTTPMSVWDLFGAVFYIVPAMAWGAAFGAYLGAPIGLVTAIIYRLPFPFALRQAGAVGAVFAIAMLMLPSCFCADPPGETLADWVGRSFTFRLIPAAIAAGAAWWMGKRHAGPGRAPLGIEFLRGRERPAAGIAALLVVAIVATCQVLPAAQDALDPVAPPVVGGVYGWHGFYLSDMSFAGVVHARLRYVDGRFPGTDISDGRDWEHIVGLSPSGDRAIVDDSDGNSYVVGPTGPLVRLSDDRRMWDWRTDIMAVGCTHKDCYRMDPRDGRRLGPASNSGYPDPRYSGEPSPDGRWNASWRCGAYGGCDVFVIEAAGREVPIGHGGPGTDWLPDGRLVYPGESGLHVVTLGDVKVEGGALRVTKTEEVVAVLRLRGGEDGLRTSPRANVAAAITDEPGRSLGLSSIRLGESPRALRGYDMPLRGNRTLGLKSISADGRYLSFEQQTDAGVRVGVRDLVTGAVEYACESGCQNLFIY
jgi:hypothetical protein